MLDLGGEEFRQAMEDDFRPASTTRDEYHAQNATARWVTPAADHLESLRVGFRSVVSPGRRQFRWKHTTSCAPLGNLGSVEDFDLVRTFQVRFGEELNGDSSLLREVLLEAVSAVAKAQAAVSRLCHRYRQASAARGGEDMRGDAIPQP